MLLETMLFHCNCDSTWIHHSLSTTKFSQVIMVKDGVAVLLLEHIVAKVVELDEDTEKIPSHLVFQVEPMRNINHGGDE